ncbi:MAG: LysM peptidoglycan-binding domain-containing protein, partial [Dehalococcoidales bacterium]|nr:LysM peptidoglycan-binding domain-containing protein [Dehalococcoidales bacterium]
MKTRIVLSILALAAISLGLPGVSVADPADGSYVVRYGDTLYSIARTLGVELQALQNANGIADASRIRAGQVLTIPGSGQSGQAPDQASLDAPGSYLVRQGDTLYSIARSLGVQLSVLQSANGIQDPSRIRTGQVLAVPGAAPAAPASDPAPTPQPAQTPVPAAAAPASSEGVYRAASPEYGMNIFIMGAASTTARDLQKVRDASFTWQKTLFQWRQIEGDGKGVFNWAESDRVVAASNTAGIKTIARLDFQPSWARSDGAFNGPPDNLADFADFVYAFVSRYKTGSPYGRVPAIELWNEPNLAREWGDRAPNPREYVALLKAGYEA